MRNQKPGIRNKKLIYLLIICLLSLITTQAHAAGPENGTPPLRPEIPPAARHDPSPPLRAPMRDLSAPPETMAAMIDDGIIPERWILPKALQTPARTEGDPVVQRTLIPSSMPPPQHTFEGIENISGIAPPDTQGDIGYDPATGRKYYVQWVNLDWAVWDVTTPTESTLIYGPVDGNAIWTGFGGPCETMNDGDPITLFDPFAQRWLMTQFAVSAEPYYECIAVSAAADPTGSWHRYAFEVSPDKMNDYPKFGVWPDAYYMTANQFLHGGSWAGAGIFAFERERMLRGEPANMIYFDLADVNINFGGMLPTDFDGAQPPPQGAPNYFIEVDDSAWLGDAQDTMRLWAFHVDWQTPENSTFGLDGLPNHKLPVANYDPLCVSTWECIPQKSSTQRVDAIGERLMYRAAYRNFDAHEAIVVNHTVDVGGQRAGIRWYEVRRSDDAWAIHQQGTFAPDDGLHRWMGSIAQDHVGNIALGYSISGATLDPAIYTTGRLANDPLGEMAQGEAVFFPGQTAQSGVNRWGDYSMMGIDPVDDCTFWYTQMYSKGSWNWATRIGSFQFPDCTLGEHGKLRGAIADAATGDPLADARVIADNAGQPPYETLTDPAGDYALSLPGGSYTVTAQAYGYASATITGITVTSDMTTTQNFALTPAAAYVVSGTVADHNTGMPLYAHLAIRGEPNDPPAARAEIWTDPQTGAYSTTLATGVTHTLQVASWAAGYLPTSTQIAPLTSNLTLDLHLDVDAAQCEAPGYRFDYAAYAYIEEFEADDGGYTVTGASPSWAYGTPVNGPGRARSGQHAWATNLSGNYQADESSYLTSPPLDLSAYEGQGFALSWWQWASTEANVDFLSVETSRDGGSNWTTVYGPISGKYDAAWTKRQVILDASYAITDVRLRFHLSSDAATTAPGWYIDDVGLLPVTIPQEAAILTENFEADGGGYITTTQGGAEHTSWERGAPTTGPDSALSGDNVWATNLDGDYLDDEQSYLLSPAFDLSAYADQEIILSWWHWAATEDGYDEISVQLSADDGATWSTIYGPRDGVIAARWTQERVNLGLGYGAAAFRVRFFLDTDVSVTTLGWYIDDVEISAIAPLTVPPTPCEAQEGGLIFGHIYDRNTGAPLIGAEVRDVTGERTSARATAEPGRDDAFYQHFLPPGAHPLTATLSGGYAPLSATVTVTNYQTQQQDFHLPAGRLAELIPGDGRAATLFIDDQLALTGALVNTGTRAARYEVWEFNAPPPDFTPVAAFLHRGRHTSPKKMNVPTLRGERYTISPPAAPRFPLGAEVITMATGLDGAWGIAHHTLSDTLWIGNTAPAGDGLLYEFEKDGTRTHRTISTTAWAADFAADLAFNPLTQKLWQVNVGGDNCIYELDPATSSPTGRTICPPVGNSQRGLAYDPLSDTYFSGAWTDSLIHRFTPEGVIIAEHDLGVAIAGLAYNPLSGHLFVAANDDVGSDIYVFDVHADYDLLGGFDVPGLGAFEQSGLTLDCDGTLWAVNQDTDVVIGIASGETDVCAWRGIPWLEVAPDQGALTASARQPLTYTYDAIGMQPGRYLAHLRITNDTPYGSLTLPVSLTVQTPATWSTISGAIHSRGYCDRHPAPLAEAAVRIAGADGYTATITTDESGRYRYALDATRGPLTVSVAAADHQPLARAGVTLTAQQTTTLDLGLRIIAPCAAVTPTAIAAKIDPTGAPSAIHTETLTLHNAGALSYTFTITELLVLQQRHEVLLISPDSSAGDISGLVTTLTAYDDVTVTIWDNAQGEPQAADLAPYDVVILGNNYTWSPELDVTAVGDAVADYIDAGGKVIESLYVQSFDAWGFGGRYIFEHYSPFTRATADYWVDDAMQIEASTHPVMRNVGEIRDVNGHQDPTVRADAEMLATWANTGLPAVAVNENVVALNLMIFQPGWQGDAPILLHNAIMWLTGAATQEVAWLAAAPTEGAVAADGQTDVTVTLTPHAEMGEGDHTASLIIATDDARAPQIAVPVTLTIGCIPLAGADFTYRPAAPRLGETVAFTGSVGGGSAPITYTWNFGDGSPIAAGQIVTHSYQHPITWTMTMWHFPVLMTAQNACSTQHVQKSLGLTPPIKLYLPLLMREGK